MTLNPKNIEPAGSCDWFTISEIPRLPPQLLRIFFMVPHIYRMEGSQNGKVFKSVRWGEEDINIQPKKQFRVQNFSFFEKVEQNFSWWKSAKKSGWGDARSNNFFCEVFPYLTEEQYNLYYKVASTISTGCMFHCQLRITVCRICTLLHTTGLKSTPSI